MNNIMTRLGDGGRVVIPAEFRKELGLAPGDRLMLVLEDGQVRLLTPQRAIERSQAVVRQYVQKGRSLSDELLAERREETTRG